MIWLSQEWSYCVFQSHIFRILAKRLSFPKNKEIIFLLQIGIFIPDPFHAVYVFDLMYEVHLLLPPSTCEELVLVPPTVLWVYLSKTMIWIRETNALFWGVGKLHYISGDLLIKRKFLCSHSEYLIILCLSQAELSRRETPISCHVSLKDFPSQNAFPENPKNRKSRTNPLRWLAASSSSWKSLVMPQFSSAILSSSLWSTSLPMPMVKRQNLSRMASLVLLRILEDCVSPTVGLPSVRKMIRDTLLASMSFWAM